MEAVRSSEMSRFLWTTHSRNREDHAFHSNCCGTVKSNNVLSMATLSLDQAVIFCTIMVSNCVLQT
jgi:hypothetical protein